MTTVGKGGRDVCDAQGDEEVTIDESKCINSFQNHRLARLLLNFPPSFGLPPPPSPEPTTRAEAPQGAGRAERQFNWQESVPENGLQILVLMCKPFSAPLGPLKKLVQRIQNQCVFVTVEQTVSGLPAARMNSLVGAA